MRFSRSTHLLMFVFTDFNVPYKNWLTYSGEIDRPGEFCYNFSISNDLTQLVNFPIRIPGCDSHSPAVLDLFISSDASICSTMPFHPLGNSDHVAISFSIDLPWNLQWDVLFHWRVYDYSPTDWDGLRDQLSLNSVLLMLLVNFVSSFRLELMYISLIARIRSSLTHLHGFELLVLLS